MKYLVSAMLLVVGIIHILPLSGALGGERLAVLYGIAIDDPNLEILMRHRAVLFGILGSFMIYAAFRSSLQPLAISAGALSVVSFLAFAAGRDYGDELARIVAADVVAVVCLGIAGLTLAALRLTS